ncbi:hypothetical protein [Saccharothrix deserti]|uniref:hypothetical protein n=1 Tax=Saccharothrix deserti TaxID=2593674 RepID=UPI00131B98F2|nr:hypothetical protein [Saccharothrix deserti]
MKSPSSRVVRAVLLGLLAVAFVVLTVLLAAGDLERGDKLASVSALFVSMVGLGIAIAGIAPPAPVVIRDSASLANDLATTLREQWLDEVAARRVKEPHVLPLTWTDGTRTSRLEGPFEDVSDDLARDYLDIYSRRLLLLGEPGSGKTVVAIVLTLGLLRARELGDPVPVLLAIASWDPVDEAFDTWLVRTLATEYYDGRRDVPSALLRDDKLIPVLDGLDEMPESDRRTAVKGINAALGRKRPIVLTCRTAEYDDAIRAGAAALRKSATARILPVSGADAVAYLTEVAPWPPGTSWEPVFEVLRTGRDTPVGNALSTPLMVSLARTGYQRCGGDPADLLDKDKFSGRDAIEHFLIDRVVDAAYAPDPLPTGELGVVGDARWTPDQAQRWLAFLARHMHRHRERDLAWWRLADRLVSPWTAPVFGVGIGVVLMLVVALGGLTVGSGDAEDVFTFGLALGAVVAVLATALWFGATGREPRRMSFQVSGSFERLRKGFAAGAAFVLVPTVPMLVAAISMQWANQTVSYADVTSMAMSVAVVLGLAVVVGTAVAAHHWTGARPERSAKATPTRFLTQDRRSSLAGAAIAGVVAALVGLPVLIVAGFLSTVFGAVAASLLDIEGTPAFDVDLRALDSPFGAIGMATVLPGLAVMLLVLLTRAWPRFVLARIALAVRGSLPWRLPLFLADARDRGLLRQSGGVYQFRHVRLQERLYTKASDTGSVKPAKTPRRRRVTALVGATAIIGATLVSWGAFNHYRCASATRLGFEVDQVLANTRNGEECVGVVPESDWVELGLAPELADRLRQGNEEAAGKADAVAVAVIGPLRSQGLDDLDRRLDGIARAQEAVRDRHPIRVVLASYPQSTLDARGPDARPFDVAMDRLNSWAAQEGLSMPVVFDSARPEVAPVANHTSQLHVGSVIGGDSLLALHAWMATVRLADAEEGLIVVDDSAGYRWLSADCGVDWSGFVFLATPSHAVQARIGSGCRRSKLQVVLGYTPDDEEKALLSDVAARLHYPAAGASLMESSTCPDACGNVEIWAYEAALALTGERAVEMVSENR